MEKLVEGVSELISTENVEHKDVDKRQEVPFSLRNKERIIVIRKPLLITTKGIIL